ncbi:DNA/RNA polymerases superfamily protein [Gossypium australe]|uniref:DNA/RNA polymerases superfamily protein n=1 Tax=Gossypium australe TaxID=47621 RepID=A0A5B6VCV5_9ROSI|nr:DNA/RNA polymerases superfamily protein [Gossypium australe]
MLRCCVIEFEGNWEKFLPLVEFAYNNSYNSSIKMAPYKDLYVLGTDLTRETEEKVKVIRNCLRAASDRQKSYVNLKRNDINISEHVTLEKGFLYWQKKDTYSAIHWSRIGSIAYRLAFSLELKNIHNVFRVSMLRKYKFDPSYVISLIEVKLGPNMSCSEESIKILAREVKELRNKRIALVKVLWQ